MPRFKAVIFDYDGTLMDSFAMLVDVYGHLGRSVGMPEPTAEVLKDYFSQATPMTQIMQELFPGQPLDELLRVNAEYLLQKADSMQVFTGVRELLDDLHDRGVKMALLTGADQKVIDMMKHHGLDHYFCGVVHCNRVSFGKPNPEGFLLAAEDCGVLPGEVIMVGDAPNDILAGKNGGAGLTIGVTYGHGSRADLIAADPDHIADSPGELHTQLSTLLNS